MLNHIESDPVKAFHDALSVGLCVLKKFSKVLLYNDVLQKYICINLTNLYKDNHVQEAHKNVYAAEGN